jgi:hypothetical protein
MVEEEALRDNPFPLVDAEIVAMGAPAGIPIIANSADDVDDPPRRKSVAKLLGYKRPAVSVHFEDPAAELQAPHTGVPVPVEVRQ